MSRTSSLAAHAARDSQAARSSVGSSPVLSSEGGTEGGTEPRFKLRSDLAHSLSRPQTSSESTGVRQHRKVAEAQKKNYDALRKHMNVADEDLDHAELVDKLQASKQEADTLRLELEQMKKKLHEEERRTTSLTSSLQASKTKCEQLSTEVTLLRAGQSLQEVALAQRQQEEEESAAVNPVSTFTAPRSPESSQQTGLSRLLSRRVDQNAIQSLGLQSLEVSDSCGLVQKVTSVGTLSTTASVPNTGWHSMEQDEDDRGSPGAHADCNSHQLPGVCCLEAAA